MNFILIHGLPATGKTTLGKQIAQLLELPFFSRDVYKELLFDVLGTGDGTVDWSRKLGASSFEVLYVTLEAMFKSGKGCVAETYWHAKVRRTTPQGFIIPIPDTLRSNFL